MILPSNPTHPQTGPWRIPARAHGAIAALILGVTALSLHFFYARGLSNLYGDGLAHMEGARRIFDSITPGYEEIGSVWLPLYHLICAPLAINDFLWRSGLAGGLVSSAAFALTCLLPFSPGRGDQSQPGGRTCGVGRRLALPELSLSCRARR